MSRKLIPLLLAVAPALLAAAPATLSVERLFAAPDLSGASLRSPRFSPDGKLVTYLQGKSEAKDRLDIWAYDPASGRNALLVDSAVLAADEGALSPEEEARRERARTSSLAGIIDYEFSPNSRYLLIPLAGDLFLYDLRANARGTAVRRLTQTTEAETDPRFSPRGNYVAFVRAQNLYVIDLATGREHAVTRDRKSVV
jgi:dipeptidyl-peptidase-4